MDAPYASSTIHLPIWIDEVEHLSASFVTHGLLILSLRDFAQLLPANTTYKTASVVEPSAVAIVQCA